MKTFLEYLENYNTNTIKDFSQGAGKDYLAYSAFLDYLEENGFQVPMNVRSESFYNEHKQGIIPFMNVHNAKLSHMRWMHESDLPQVSLIDAFGTNPPLTQQELMNHLRNRTGIGYVAEADNGSLLGFMLYTLHQDKLQIERLAVHPFFRNKGVGKEMVDRLKRKLSTRRSSLDTTHPEEMQGFYGKQGFTTTPTRSTYRGEGL